MQRADFFKLKCCSLDRRDLEKHFKNVTQRFYQIGGYNDPNLKQAFLSSVPDLLGDKAFRLLTSAGKELRIIALGELFQLVIRALEKMCSHNKFLREYTKQSNKMDKVCHKKGLTIKCPKHECHPCPTKKSSRRKIKTFKSSRRFPADEKRQRRSFKFLRRMKTSNKPRRCFTCGKRGHFAKQCP